MIFPRWELLVVCPRDQQDLWRRGENLVCGKGHRYAVVEDCDSLPNRHLPAINLPGLQVGGLAKEFDPSAVSS
jgi:hypothetical protein